MPTSRDYLQSATRLTNLVGEMGAVMDRSQRDLPPAKLSGGLLAAKVEEVIARRAADSRSYAQGIQRLALECRTRGQEAGALDYAWNRYDRSYDRYLDDVDNWEVARDLYVADPFSAPHPGPPPEAPVAPSPIPDWYDRTP